MEAPSTPTVITGVVPRATYAIHVVCTCTNTTTTTTTAVWKAAASKRIYPRTVVFIAMATEM